MKLTILSLTAMLTACGGPTETPDIEMSYGGLTERDERPSAEPIDPERERDPEVCRGGLIHARATALGDDGVGHFSGVFTNRAGDRVGWVRGLYGHRENGTNAIFGKMISRNGAFEARFRGLWERGDGAIEFRARLHGRAEHAIGTVRGRIEDLDRRGGEMTARRALNCDDTMEQRDLPASSDVEERGR
jgi:hypothetical protein